MSKNILARNIQSARMSFQPLFGTLEITQKCNLRCKHCYNFNRSQTPDLSGQLTTKEILKTLDDLKDLGVLSLNITGGEPLLHPDIFQILEYAKGHSFHLRLKTNGTLVKNEQAYHLRKSGVKEVDISLYGADEDTYLAFSGKKGFQKTVDSINAFVESGIQTNVSIILHRGNYRQLGLMIDLVKNLKAQFYLSDEITDRYDGTLASQSYALNIEEYQELLRGPFRHFFDHENTDKAIMCGCAKSVIGINAFGEVFPCIGAPLSSGNIRHQDLKSIWRDSPTLNRIRSLEFKDFKDCSECNLIEKCSRSSGSAHINTGNYTGCDPVAHTHARARSLLRDSTTELNNSHSADRTY